MSTNFLPDTPGYRLISRLIDKAQLEIDLLLMKDANVFPANEYSRILKNYYEGAFKYRKENQINEEELDFVKEDCISIVNLCILANTELDKMSEAAKLRQFEKEMHRLFAQSS